MEIKEEAEIGRLYQCAILRSPGQDFRVTMNPKVVIVITIVSYMYIVPLIFQHIFTCIA